jgi:hypothetical protein
MRFAHTLESNRLSAHSALAFCILAAVLGSGCAHVSLVSEITSFHTLAAVGSGETFVVLP